MKEKNKKITHFDKNSLDVRAHVSNEFFIYINGIKYTQNK